MKPGMFAMPVSRYPRAQTYGVEPASREPASREPGPRHVPAGAVAGSSPLIPPEFYRVKFSTDPEITPSVYNEPRWSVIQTGQAAVITHLNKESVIQVTETYDDDQRGRILGFKARTGEQELREELSNLRKKGLKERAKDLGISDEQIDSAEDEDNPTAAIVELVVTATAATLGVELKDGWVAERGDGYTLAKIADLEIWPRGVPESAESQYDFSGIKFIPEDRPFLMVNDDQLVRVFQDKELERGARLMIGSRTSPDPAERARGSIAMNFLYSSNSFMNVSHKQRSHRPEERDEPASRNEATSRYLKYGVTGDIIQIIGKYTPGFNQLGDHTAYEVEYFNAPEYGGLPRPHRCWINAADLLFFTRLDGGDDLGVQDETPFWITARQRAWIYPRYRAKVELLARAAPEISSAQIEQLAVGREFNIDKWVEVPSKGGAPMVKRMRINRNSAWISERNSENGEPFCEKLEPEQVTDADTIGMTYHDPTGLQKWMGDNAESEVVLGPEPAPAEGAPASRRDLDAVVGSEPAPPPEKVEEAEPVQVEEGHAEPEEERWILPKLDSTVYLLMNNEKLVKWEEPNEVIIGRYHGSTEDDAENTEVLVHPDGILEAAGALVRGGVLQNGNAIIPFTKMTMSEPKAGDFWRVVGQRRWADSRETVTYQLKLDLEYYGELIHVADRNPVVAYAGGPMRTIKLIIAFRGDDAAQQKAKFIADFRLLSDEWGTIFVLGDDMTGGGKKSTRRTKKRRNTKRRTKKRRTKKRRNTKRRRTTRRR